MSNMVISKKIGDNIIIECKNGITKLYVVHIPDGKGSEVKPFDFNMIPRFIPDKDIKVSSRCDDKSEHWKITSKYIGLIELTKCKINNTIDINFTLAGSTQGPIPIKAFIKDGEYIVHENNRIWKYNKVTNKWFFVKTFAVEG